MVGTKWGQDTFIRKNINTEPCSTEDLCCQVLSVLYCESKQTESFSQKIQFKINVDVLQNMQKQIISGAIAGVEKYKFPLWEFPDGLCVFNVHLEAPHRHARVT